MRFPNLNLTNNTEKLRIISTARTLDNMNQAVKDGHQLIFVRIKPSSKIKTKYAVVQDKITKEISEIHDYRMWDSSTHDILVDWTYTYPYQFPLPFAAYVIPSDINIGEKVYLEDLIEDYVGKSWNQGDCYRLKSCTAIWDGKKLNILYDPAKNNTLIVG